MEALMKIFEEVEVQDTDFIETNKTCGELVNRFKTLQNIQKDISLANLHASSNPHTFLNFHHSNLDH